jgi:hypothetical protein
MTERARHRATAALGLGAAIGLSVWAAATDPFTSAADTVSAIGIGLVALEVAVRWRRRVLVVGVDPDQAAPARWWPWLALAAALLALELASFFSGPRVDHPTISSLYDSATRWRAVKAAFFLGWLCLGAALVRS